MGREVRRVPANWEHPRDEQGHYLGLYEGYADTARRFLEMVATKSLQDAVRYFGGAPDANDYMPEWPDAERTHLMMYENTSEGTPISPAFATPEELARWLADNGASAFAGQTADYDAWLRVCRGGWAPSAALMPGRGLISGVDALKDKEP